MKTVKNLGKGIIVLALAVITLAVTSAVLFLEIFPSKKEIRDCLTTQMYHVRLCPTEASYSRLKEISPFLQKTVIISEDGSFYAHHGFDFEEMKRSLKKNLAVGHFARGGSTLTQQLAKNLFLTEEKTMLRKLKEAVITLRLEQTLNKKEILEKYLNVVHWGPQVFGIKSAAKFYFKKSPAELNLVESAFLAMLLPSPVKYSKPFLHKSLTPFARGRIEDIIEKLHLSNRITDDEYLTAQNQLAAFNPKVDSSDELYLRESEEEEELEENPN